jgi:hypothetical protein
MFDRILRTAMESGGEVIVETKYACDGLKGKVLDFDGTHFTLFHNGTGGGMLWVVRVEDIACCGLVVDVPSALSELAEPNQATDLNLSSIHSCLHRPKEEGA